MTIHTAVLGLLTETSLHAGAGQMLGVIDLPIQREAHTGWPCVFGSGVKGALRARAMDLGWQKTLIESVFGPEVSGGSGSEHAGAVAVGDARLLLLPIRSLTTHFKWVTCPALLQRWQNDMQRLNLQAVPFQVPSITDTNKQQVLMAEAHEQDLFLEEFRFTCQSHDLNALIKALSNLMGMRASALSKQLVIMHDDLFRHLCEHATPVTPHIKIEYETKTVEGGALWYEESLPPDTLMYTALLAQQSRHPKESERKPADVMLQSLLDTFKEHNYLQLGGNETVGMGWCQVEIVQQEAAK